MTSSLTKRPQKWVQHISAGGCAVAETKLKEMGPVLPYALATCDECIFSLVMVSIVMFCLGP